MQYPSHILWKISFQNYSSVEEIFSKKTYKKILSSYKRMLEFGYEFEIKIVTPDFIKIFLPLYENNILKKRNGNIRDVLKYYQNYKDTGIPFYCLILNFNGELCGALLFTERKDRLSAVVKYFPSEAKCKLPSNITLVVEYLFFKEAYKLKKKGIYHGVDTNVFGVNSEIGLAMFKLQIGCRPHISSVDSTYSISDKFIWDEKEDVLIFHGSKPKEKIVSSTLYITDKQLFKNSQDKYGALLKCSDIKTQIKYKTDN